MPHFSTSDVINCCLSCALALCACTWLNAANLFAQRPRTCQICPLTVVPSSTVNFLSTTCETLRARYQPTSLPAYQLAVSSHQSALPTYQLAISSYQVPLPTCCIQYVALTAHPNHDNEPGATVALCSYRYKFSCRSVSTQGQEV